MTRTILIDDLDGTDIDVETVRFSIDKQVYEIDLSAENAAKLRGTLDKFIGAGHQLRESKRVARKKIVGGAVSKEQTQAIRHWARERTGTRCRREDGSPATFARLSKPPTDCCPAEVGGIGGAGWGCSLGPGARCFR